MKKFVLSMMIALVATMLINFPVSQARSVRFADVGAENFVNQIRQLINSNTKGIIISELKHLKEFDYPISNPKILRWECNFYMADNLDSRGELTIYTDSEGYVLAVTVSCSKSDISVKPVPAILRAVCAHLTSDEYMSLLKNKDVWSSYYNRRYVMLVEETSDNVLLISLKALNG